MSDDFTKLLKTDGLFGGAVTEPTWKTAPPLTREDWAAILAEDNRRRESGLYDQPRAVYIDQRTYDEWRKNGWIK